jgi:hypothetical protein
MKGEKGISFQSSAQYMIIHSHPPEKISYLICQMTPFYDNEKPENTDSTYVGGCTR